VSEYRQRGGHQRGPGRDQDDLPAVHAAGTDGVGWDPGWDKDGRGLARMHNADMRSFLGLTLG
jgi:hypothetical protein